MNRLRAISAICLCLLMALTPLAGCGSAPDEEALLREEAVSCLREMGDVPALRYRLHLETWVGVTGQTVYGDERCEGSVAGKDYMVSVKRSTPVSKEEFALLFAGGRLYRQKDGSWTETGDGDALNPLYDPRCLYEPAKGARSATLEGEEERGGVSCRRILLRLDPGCVDGVLSANAMSYFSHLRFEPTLRIWASDIPSPPLSLQLEVPGYDPAESLLRYRLLATLDLYDLGAPDIALPRPE